MINENLIGERISQFRQAKNYSRAEFAEFMAVSVQAVGKWERGESMPDILTMKKIADVLECDINEFLRVQGEMSDASESEGEGDTQAQPEQKRNVGKDIKGFIRNVYDFSMSNWRNGDFSGLKNISNKFKNSNVISCKFCSSDLKGITFKANSIKNCDFSRADLSAAQISASNIRGTSFSECNMSEAIIKFSDIKDCDFSKTNLKAAKIHSTAFLKNNISGASLDFAEFKNTSFENVVFNTDLEQASFIGCTFKNTQFENITLKDVFFKNCLTKKPKLINCKVTKMTYSFLSNCKCDLSQVEIIE